MNDDLRKLVIDLNSFFTPKDSITFDQWSDKYGTSNRNWKLWLHEGEGSIDVDFSVDRKTGLNVFLRIYYRNYDPPDSILSYYYVYIEQARFYWIHLVNLGFIHE